MKSLYLLVNLFTVIVPFLFSFHPRLNFYKNWRPFFIANILVAAIFISWDIIFTDEGVWGFNPKYVSGVYFFNLPIEEVLFFVCIPYACVFTYHCINLFYKIQLDAKFQNILVGFISAALLISGIYFQDKNYTAATFISLFVILFLIAFVAKANWLGKLLAVYPFLLIPFFIVNGILTGSRLEEPVVWYNDNENLGFRLWTIPIEDIFYGFLLILLNIFFYEIFKKKFVRS